MTAVAVGVAALPDAPRVDFDRLRADRRERLVAAMAANDVDVLVLGRPANVLYASGARQLWTAGARPFGPGCVVVRSTGRVHLLSVWDEGVPSDIGREELYGLSWNPANLLRSLRAIPGLPGARRIATDSLSPGFPRLLDSIAPGAELVAGDHVSWAARTVKTPDELVCIATATALAESSLGALVQALRPGVREDELLALHAEHLARSGVPTVPSEAVVCATPRTGPVTARSTPSARPIGPGELVVLDPGALYAGYEGGVGRTWPARQSRLRDDPAQLALARRCRRALQAVLDACCAGATGADLLVAWATTGEVTPGLPIAHGLGLGAEPPVIADGIGADAVLTSGMVLAVQAWVAAEGIGGCLEREVVVVRDGGVDVLSRFPRWFDDGGGEDG